MQWTRKRAALVAAGAALTVAAAGTGLVLAGGGDSPAPAASVGVVPTAPTTAPIQHSYLGPALTPTPTPVPTITPTPSPTISPTPSASASPPLQNLARRAEQQARVQSTQSQTPTPAQGPTFRIATFNALGASHTTAKGDSSNKRSGTVRTADAVRILEREGIDVVGFQEFQGSQVDYFKSLTAGRWAMVTVGHQTIAWRSHLFDLIQQATFTIPYFRGMKTPSPGIVLRQRATGKLVGVLNVHNPASLRSMGSQAANRAKARAIEIKAMNALAAKSVPTILVGDMNERDEFFCDVSRGVPQAQWAAGGSYSPGRCSPPSPAPIDWIVGTSQVAFSNYRSVRDTLVRQTTDHPVNLADVTLR